MDLLFLGCGNIGRPIFEYIKKSHIFDKIDIVDPNFESDKILENVRYLKKFNLDQTKYDCLFIAIKPQVFTKENLQDYLNLNFDLVVSIMAGKKIQSIKEIFGNNQKISRIMPNMGVTSGNSYSLVDWTENFSADDIEIIKKILSSIGDFTRVDEKFFNIATIASSCMPAFIYKFCDTFAEEIINSGFASGISKEEIYKMTASSLLCSAKNFESNQKKTLNQLTSEICSKGGMTEVGVEVLSSETTKKLLSDIIFKVMERAEKL